MEEIKKLSIPDGYEFDKVEDGEVMLKKKINKNNDYVKEVICRGYYLKVTFVQNVGDTPYSSPTLRCEDSGEPIEITWEDKK